MADAESQNFILTYWKQLLFALGIGAIAVKNQVSTRRIENAVFDKSGDNRFVRITECRAQVNGCKNDQETRRTELRQELDKIHASVADLRKDVQALPLEILKLQKK
jgi:hypothetical protein